MILYQWITLGLLISTVLVLAIGLYWVAKSGKD